MRRLCVGVLGVEVLRHRCIVINVYSKCDREA